MPEATRLPCHDVQIDSPKMIRPRWKRKNEDCSALSHNPTSSELWKWRQFYTLTPSYLFGSLKVTMVVGFEDLEPKKWWQFPHLDTILSFWKPKSDDCYTFWRPRTLQMTTVTRFEDLEPKKWRQFYIFKTKAIRLKKKKKRNNPLWKVVFSRARPPFYRKFTRNFLRLLLLYYDYYYYYLD